MNTAQGEKMKKPALLFGAAYLAVLAFLLWKCRYGFASNDEAFYLTIPYRLCRGDGLILQEWHLSQLSAVLLYPAMWLYFRLGGPMEGILLSFRVLFTLVWAGNALFLYVRLKKLTLPGAMAAALSFLLYAPYGIMALSYNSLGILLLLDACVILMTAEKHPELQSCAAGLLFAGAVLCCPYLVLLYVLFTLTALPGLRKERTLFRRWVFVSLGCLILALAFLALLLSRAPFSRLMQALPLLFEDPEHPRSSLAAQTWQYFKAIGGCSRLFLPFLLAEILILILTAKGKGEELGFCLVCGMSMLLSLRFLLFDRHINYFMFPINMIAPYCALRLRRREILLPFRAIWLPGLVYGYCISLSSNQGFYAISSAASVMTAASLLILFRYARLKAPAADRTRMGRAVRTAVLLVLTLQIGTQFYMRYQSVFWERSMREQTVAAESGPEKGIRMTPERFAVYQRQLADVEKLRGDRSIRSLLVLSEDTWLYLGAEKEIAAYSAWLSGVNEHSLARLDRYYALLPEKTPDGIYIAPENVAWAERFIERGYVREELPSGGLLLRRA